MVIQSNDSKLGENSGLGKPIAKKSYLIGLLVIFAAVYSQYLFPHGFGLILGSLIVYGIPIVITVLLWGSVTIRRALSHMYTAVKYGLGFFGAFTVLGILVSAGILFIMLIFNPAAQNLLNKPNPVLNIPPGLAWVMVFGSFLVGPAEEYLFRGFVYGGLLSLFKNRHWLSLAFISSILFTAVHLYYAFTYGIASLIPFTDLMTFGMAMAATYYFSEGNLLIPGLIHGAYDATGFISVATTLNVGLLLRGIMISISIFFAIALFIQRGQIRGQGSSQRDKS